MCVMNKCREAFEQYIRSQSGFTADFQIGCNGQYKSDLMHFMFVTWQYQQKQIDELNLIIELRDQQLTDEIALSTKYVGKFDELQVQVNAIN